MIEREVGMDSKEFFDNLNEYWQELVKLSSPTPTPPPSPEPTAEEKTCAKVEKLAHDGWFNVHFGD